MTRKSLPLTPRLYDYLLAVGVRQHPVLERLAADTARMAEANMQISPAQGAFMAFLVELMGAKRCLEIGVFTGYSALAVALALPDDGRLLACDVNEKWTTMARSYWAEAGVKKKIHLHLAPAIKTLDDLLTEGAASSFDFAFLDADKTEYAAYYERVLKLLRPGGLMMVDNVLYSGHLADPNKTGDNIEALRNFNTALHHDQRITLSMIPVADGLTLAIKRP
jgi:predicted O-methyltransferase YrrM